MSTEVEDTYKTYTTRDLIFAGRDVYDRFATKPSLSDVWFYPDENRYMYFPAGKAMSFVIGGMYECDMTGENSMAYRGAHAPKYTGKLYQHPDTVTEWQVRTRGAQGFMRMKSQEAKDTKHSYIGEALKPVKNAMRKAKTRLDRELIIAIVIDELYNNY